MLVGVSTVKWQQRSGLKGTGGVEGTLAMKLL